MLGVISSRKLYIASPVVLCCCCSLSRLDGSFWCLNDGRWMQILLTQHKVSVSHTLRNTPPYVLCNACVRCRRKHKHSSSAWGYLPRTAASRAQSEDGACLMPGATRPPLLQLTEIQLTEMLHLYTIRSCSKSTPRLLAPGLYAVWLGAVGIFQTRSYSLASVTRGIHIDNDHYGLRPPRYDIRPTSHQPCGGRKIPSILKGSS